MIPVANLNLQIDIRVVKCNCGCGAEVSTVFVNGQQLYSYSLAVEDSMIEMDDNGDLSPVGTKWQAWLNDINADIPDYVES